MEPAPAPSRAPRPSSQQDGKRGHTGLMPTKSIPTLSTGAITLPGRRDSLTGPRWHGIVAQIASSMVSQTGAATASTAITAMGAPAVVAVRQTVAAAVLLPIARPRIRRLRGRSATFVVLLGLATATMNLGLYSAIDRLGLALAVTLEFLGPLSVAIAGSRRVKEFFAAGLAGVGVVVLVHPSGSTDWIGVGFAFLAAGSWAGYILLNRTVGGHFPGIEGAALSASVGAILATPALIILGYVGVLTTGGVLLAALAGVLCSVVPMAADLFALRRIEPRLFGVLASANPVAAAAAAILLLHEFPTAVESAGIGIIVGANVLATAPTRQLRSSTPGH